MLRTSWLLSGLVLFAGGIASGTVGQEAPGQTATGLMPVFVHVIDRNRTPIGDLKQEEFTVTEDGALQEIQFFAVETLAPGTPQPPPRLIRSEASPLQPQGRRLFVFALGAGKLETGSKGITELLSFVNTRLLPQDHVAVFAYGRGLGFSADRQRLVEVLGRFRKDHEDVDFEISQQMGPTGMAPLYGTRALPERLQSKIEQLLFGPAGRTPSLTTADALEHTAFETLSLDDFTASTAVTAQDQGNLVALLEYLRHFEGRKHLVFVTEKGLLWPSEATDRSLAELANEGWVSIHALQVGGILKAEQGREMDATHQMARSFGSLRTLSELTGGLAFITEESRAALQSLDTVTRTGYLVGYSPSNRAWDNRHRKIAVSVKRPGVTVLYRHGYRREQAVSGFNRRSFIVNERLLAGGIFRREVNDIRVKASAGVREGRVNVQGTINISKVRLEKEDGALVGLLNVAVFSFDSGSNGLGGDVRELPIKLTPEELKQYQRNGLPYSIQVPLFHGVTTLRVVVYDYGTDLIGRVDTTLY
ncbi:MAG: VWA domain-containing protein [Vicinamibacterales bacterium]